MNIFEKIEQWFNSTIDKINEEFNSHRPIKNKWQREEEKLLQQYEQMQETKDKFNSENAGSGLGGGGGGMRENEIETTQQNATEIPDTTLENIEQPINGVGQSDIFKFIEEQQKKQWEREDTLRKETQMREDSSYQRAVRDMEKAGINPNLMNVQPSASGGGITQATGLDYSLIDNEMKEQLTLLQQEIDQAFKEDENSKDRFIDIFGSVLQMLAIKLITKL